MECLECVHTQTCKWVLMHVGTRAQHQEAFPRSHHLGFIFETGPLISLDLSKWSRLAEQQTPRACFYLPSPGTTSSPHSAFLHGFWGPNSGSHVCVASTLQTKLSSPTRRALTPMLWSIGNLFNILKQ